MSNSILAYLKTYADLPVNVLHMGLILLLAWLVHFLAHRVLRSLREYMARRAESHEQGKRIETLGRVAKHLLSLAIVVVAGMLMLSVLGISIAPILGAAGVVGIAVGFAAQSLLKDYFNGFFLLLENQLRLGDQVEMGGKNGMVEEITLRYVRLRSDDGVVHFVPNSLANILRNRSLDFAWTYVDIGVAPQSNLATCIEALSLAAASVFQDPMAAKKLVEAPQVLGVHAIGEHAVQLRVQFKTVPNEQAFIRRCFYAQVLENFARTSICLAEPRRLVQV